MFLNIFAGAYINISKLGYSKEENFLIEKVFNIGVKHEHELFNNFNMVYDVSYISPLKQYKKFFPEFPLGYASYDFGFNYKLGYLKLSYIHNCTHKFESGINFYWFDNWSNTVEIEIDF